MSFCTLGPPLKMRIATGGISHETHTFSPIRTGLENFARSPIAGGILRGQEIIQAFQGTSTITGGFLEAAQECRLELLPLLWTFAMPSGLVTQEAYEALKAEMLDRLEQARPVNGILLDLHGAMVAEHLEDAEGDLLAAFRARVGPEVPIIATLDLHANITEAMASQADSLIGFKTYPHVDMRERGLEAGRLMGRILNEGLRPAMARVRVPLIAAPSRQCTYYPPMKEVMEKAQEFERKPGMLNVTVAAGFAYADILESSFSVVATAAGDRALAHSSARELAEFLWQRREQFLVQLTPIPEAIDFALRSGQGPVILADTADNPGGGTPCDGTVILQHLVQANAPRAVVAVIADPDSVLRCIHAGVGQTVALEVGGKTDSLHGPPLRLTGQVRLLSDGRFTNKGPMMTGVEMTMGRAAVFQCGGVEVVLTERRVQPKDAQLLRSLGIEPKDRLIIVLKSSVHFRADYGPIAKAIFEVDAPGLLHPDLTRFSFRRLKRPCFPLDHTGF